MNFLKRLFSKKKKERVVNRGYSGWYDYPLDNPISNQIRYDNDYTTNDVSNHHVKVSKSDSGSSSDSSSSSSD